MSAVKWKKRILAYYLPQFHETPENNEWWGKGYTEWTAIKNWRPHFRGHRLRKPTDLGYYDLLEPGVIEKQYDLASRHGIEGFCFWTYWFGNGETLLEKPMQQLLESKSRVRYCIAWANHTWFNKTKGILLKEQKYLGREDYAKFFEAMLPHFKSGRYIMESNRPVVAIYIPEDIPDLEVFRSTWDELARKNGFDGIYLVADKISPNLKRPDLFDAFTHSLAMFSNRSFLQKVRERLIRQHGWTFLGPVRYSFAKTTKNAFKRFQNDSRFLPIIFTGWDTTPRHGKRGVVLEDFTEQAFSSQVNEALNFPNKTEFVFIKSWNEWAEGNALEPDDRFGKTLLDIVRKANLDNN